MSECKRLKDKCTRVQQELWRQDEELKLARRGLLKFQERKGQLLKQCTLEVGKVHSCYPNISS